MRLTVYRYKRGYLRSPVRPTAGSPCNVVAKSRSGGLFLLALDVQDRLALVAATVRADGVREAHASALLALNEMHGLKRVVGATAIAAALGQFAFWMRWHCVLLDN